MNRPQGRSLRQVINGEEMTEIPSSRHPSAMQYPLVHPAVPERYEYLVVVLRVEDVDEATGALNAHGTAGWEAFGATARADGSVTVFAKRPIRS
jgi:hypothetical protein